MENVNMLRKNFQALFLLFAACYFFRAGLWLILIWNILPSIVEAGLLEMVVLLILPRLFRSENDKSIFNKAPTETKN